MPPEGEPKLIIDSDWKSQAQAEKDRLAQAAPAKAKGGATPGAAGAGGAPGEEKVRFEDIIALMATQALSYLGYFPDPRSGQAMVSLEYAKLHIDMLGILQEKTKGNLDEKEDAAMSRTVSELRLAFAEVQTAVSKAVAEGRIKPMSAGGGGGMGGSGLVTPE